MKKSISSVLLIGSAWGIVEASVGHVLHTFTLGIGWLFWFPIAFFFLNFAYIITKKTSFMLYSAVIAAGIKMIDLFYTPRYDYVINPAVSILLEALTVFAVYRLILHKVDSVKLDMRSILLAGFGWKVLYICYLFFLPESWMNLSCLSGLIPFAKFFFLETVMNTLLIYLFILAIQSAAKLEIKAFHRVKESLPGKSILLPLCSFFTFVFAIFLQIKL